MRSAKKLLRVSCLSLSARGRVSFATKGLSIKPVRHKSPSTPVSSRPLLILFALCVHERVSTITFVHRSLIRTECYMLHALRFTTVHIPVPWLRRVRSAILCVCASLVTHHRILEIKHSLPSHKPTVLPWRLQFDRWPKCAHCTTTTRMIPSITTCITHPSRLFPLSPSHSCFAHGVDACDYTESVPRQVLVHHASPFLYVVRQSL
jgi:hypothetical protein